MRFFVFLNKKETTQVACFNSHKKGKEPHPAFLHCGIVEALLHSSPRCPAPMTGCALRARKLRFGGESGNAAPHRTKEEGCRPTAPTGRSGTVVAGLAATSPPRGVLLREWRVGVYGRRAMTLPALTCGMLSGEHRDLKGPPNTNSGRRPPPLLWARRSSDGTTRSRNFRQ